MGDIYHAGSTYAGSLPIDDTKVSDTSTWSSQKINNEIAVLNELGAKNLLPNTATTQTVSGVTFTVNSDGTVTVNGTSTALIRFTLAIGDIGLESGKQYIFSGLPENSNSKYLQYVYGDGTTPSVNITSINGGIITPSNHSGQSFDIIISANQTLSNYTFKPMLRLASDPDNTYQPYAMTNRELTKAVVHSSGDYNAGQITYNNTGGIISASNVQGAIDKLKDVTLVGNIVIVASWAQVQTALTTKVSSMKNNTIENMIIACSAAFTQMPYGGYFATQVSKTNNNLWSALLHGYRGEVKHISYNSGEYLFDDIGSDMFAWKDLGVFDVTGTSQSQAFVISGRIHEFLIAYGQKNSTLVYGGGTVVLKNRATDNVCFLPVYVSGGTTIIGMVCLHVSAANTVTYYSANVASGYSLLIRVYYR